MKFHEIRRQQFLGEQYFKHFSSLLPESIEYWKNNIPANSETVEFGRTIAFERAANLSFQLYLLRYTAGETLNELQNYLTELIFLYESFLKCENIFQKKIHTPVFAFQEIDDFERLVQLVSLAFLLHRRDLIVRIHSLIAGSAYDGEDAMYEELIGHQLPDRPYLDEWYHQLPYIHLLNASDAQTSEEQVAQMQLYLNAWYPAMQNAPWHDSHLDTSENGGAYFGYWAIEAAAIVYLYNIDDSSFRDHIVYPKDLVDFARQWDRDHTNTSATDSHSVERAHLRTEGGQPCPVAGYWETPAQANSRRYFVQDEILPVFGDAAYGATIWQWAENQEGE